MKSRAIVTVCMGDSTEKLAAISHARLLHYAGRIDAEFVVIRSDPDNDPLYARYQMRALLNDYPRILFIDTDVLIAADCPDLFNVVPESMFGVYIEGEECPRNECMADIQRLHGDIGWRETYFNAGLMVVSRCHKDVFSFEHGRYRGEYLDQTQVNYNVQKLRIPIHPLERRFNYFAAAVHQKRLLRSPGRFGAYIVHYAGLHRLPEARLALMRSDDLIFRRYIEGGRLSRFSVILLAKMAEAVKRTLRR